MNYIDLYAKFLRRFLKPPAEGEARHGRQKKLRVVFDCSNGPAGLILKQLTADKKQLTAFFINDKPDGNFPGHGPDPLRRGALRDLQSAIKKFKADLGIIFDADADRVFFVDNKERFINPDAIARLLIWRLKPKKIIIDARTGWLVKKSQMSRQRRGSPEAADVRYQMFQSRVGHFFIKKLMRKNNVDFGAEYSGHYYFKKFFFDDSGILAAIEVINAVSKLPYSLADFINLLPQYFSSPEINFKIKNPNEFIKKIEKYYKLKAKSYKLKAIKHIDGLTMEFNPPAGGWWFNLRPSNTEPLLRLNVEARNKNLLDKEIKKLHSLVSKFK